jgi:hypothetical protein
MLKDLTLADVEQELEEHYVSAEASAGLQGLGMFGLGLASGSSSSSDNPGPGAMVLEAIARDRRVVRSLRTLPRHQRGILAACYEPVSTWKVGPGERTAGRARDERDPLRDRKAFMCALCGAKALADKSLVTREVHRAHLAYLQARRVHRAQDAALVREARELGQARRAAMLARQTEERMARDAWTDLEVEAWSEELGFPTKGEAA